MNRREGKELVGACYAQKWEEAKAMIAKNPQLVRTRNSTGYSPAFWVAEHGNLEMLNYILDAILIFLQERQQQQQQEKEKQQMLRDAFERGDDYEWTPAHVAASWGRTLCLVFLAEHAPSGAAVLQEKAEDGFTPAWAAVHEGETDVVDFILRHAPGDIMRVVEMMKDNKSTRWIIPYLELRILPRLSTFKSLGCTGVQFRP
jgi:ankyrin repeat protein